MRPLLLIACAALVLVACTPAPDCTQPQAAAPDGAVSSAAAPTSAADLEVQPIPADHPVFIWEAARTMPESCEDDTFNCLAYTAVPPEAIRAHLLAPPYTVRQGADGPQYLTMVGPYRLELQQSGDGWMITTRLVGD